MPYTYLSGLVCAVAVNEDAEIKERYLLQNML
jgi:hypothetical protein